MTICGIMQEVICSGGALMQKLTIMAKDGAEISAELYEAVGDAKGIIVVSHGFGEYAGMYAELAGIFGQAGYACILFDQRGHGEQYSGKKNRFGVIPDYLCFLDDVVSVTEAARR